MATHHGFFQGKAQELIIGRRPLDDAPSRVRSPAVAVMTMVAVLPRRPDDRVGRVVIPTGAVIKLALEAIALTQDADSPSREARGTPSREARGIEVLRYRYQQAN